MMISTVIGGAMLPHAPQFFTQPESEDKSVIAEVQKVAKEIGDKLKALKPDLWIIFSNDHAEQFFHNAAPPFTIHVGGEATANLPDASSIGRFRVRSVLLWFANSIGKISILHFHRPPRLTTR